MKRLTTDEYSKLCAFIYRHHKFGVMRTETHNKFLKEKYPNMPGNMMIKYISYTYDTRFMSADSITLEGMGRKVVLSIYDDVKYQSLADYVKAFLIGDYKTNK